jgi:hypothetical protein
VKLLISSPEIKKNEKIFRDHRSGFVTYYKCISI